MSKGRVIDHKWYTPGIWNNLPMPYTVQIGVVLVHYPDDGYVQAYLGIGFAEDPDEDSMSIAASGAKLEPKVARAHFPGNDIPYKGEVQ